MRIVTITVLFLLFQNVNAAWIPPTNPDPILILNEAENDFESGNYENSLSKHIWFHENSLKYKESLYGVRLSYALDKWLRLSKAYPPAFQALETIRDNKELAIRKETEISCSFNLFHDFESINEKIGSEERTIELFIWLDNNQPQKAKRVYRIAQPYLLDRKMYQLCGKYVNPKKEFMISVETLNVGISYIKESKRPVNEELYEYEYFSNSIALLVSILVQNERKDEAKEIVKNAVKIWDSTEFEELLMNVLNGYIPDPESLPKNCR